MDTDWPITFLVDEHLPQGNMRRVLAPHATRFATISAKDPEILHSAEEQRVIVITSDVWFMKELFRLPVTDRRCFKRAGVVQVPGEWDRARQRLIDYLPVIEAMYRLTRNRPGNQRIGINLSQSEIRIKDPWV